MEVISVKRKDGWSIYTSGWTYRRQADEWVEIEQTEEQQKQRCYESLISDTRKDEFEKAMRFFISFYLNISADSLNRIEINYETDTGKGMLGIHKWKF